MLSGPLESEETALETVRTWMGSTETLEEFRRVWVTRPYRAARLVRPVEPKRGAPMYLVLRGVIHRFPSARTKSMDQYYEELLARQPN